MTDANNTPQVLIADDEEHVRSFLRAALTHFQCLVAGEAASGEEAVKKYRELQPDLVLLDHNMPYKTGDEVLAEILAADPAAKVAVLSSVTDSQKVKQALDGGAICYLRKDLPMDQILTRIQTCLREICGKEPENGCEI